MKTIDLLHENVTAIELIEHVREPNTEFDACYILASSDANVRRIIEDLSNLGGGPQIYANGHVFFVDGTFFFPLSFPHGGDGSADWLRSLCTAVPQGVVNQLATSAAGPRLKGIVELFMDVWPLQGQVFSGQRPQTFHALFQPALNPTHQEADWSQHLIGQEIQSATKAIVNTCILLNEFPLVRY